MNGEEITKRDLVLELRSTPGLRPQDLELHQQALLDQIINRKLLAQRATAEGLRKDPDYLATLRLMREQLLADRYSRNVTPSPQTTRRQLKAYIQANPHRFASRRLYVLQQIEMPADAYPSASTGIKVPLSELEKLTASLGPDQVIRSDIAADTKNMTPAEAAMLASLPASAAGVVTSGDRLRLVHVRSFEEAPITGNAAAAEAQIAIQTEQLATSVRSKVNSLRSSAKIEYQPSYSPQL
ncbi:hypothetical protein KFK14_22310 [Sphingobium phenoxybenzoativorans]|uniref:Peptidyl-prolyl cis-trans isomerase, EpsD family n=1 Tax=Sphingobium phenoxybenzoativorans TaxID=1592790 RepID=A0A975Q1G6_9SPHN|nr:hypothetical protein [Sphingobium phenoxybenzoativorans]QUT05651.1 hypothetical protein KFK14_22310 [Sphingobium phenoxybenzoativorans]